MKKVRFLTRAIYPSPNRNPNPNPNPNPKPNNPNQAAAALMAQNRMAKLLEAGRAERAAQ